MSARKVGFHDETDALKPAAAKLPVYGEGEDDNRFDDSTEAFVALKMDSFGEDTEYAAAERLSMRLLSIPDDDEDEHDRILRESLHLVALSTEVQKRKSMRAQQQAGGRFGFMLAMLVLGLALLGVAFYVGAKVIGPPSQPLGPYQLVERQVRVCGETIVL